MAKSLSSMEDPVVLFDRNLYGHILGGLSNEKQFEQILLQHGWEKAPNWECFFVHREKGLFSYVYVDDIKFTGKKQNIDWMWKVLNKEVDLGEEESRISAGETKKLQYSENVLCFSIVLGCGKFFENMSGIDQKHNSTIPYIDDHQF